MNGRRAGLAAAVAVALAGTLVLAQAPAPQAPDTPRFRADANVVVVEATVIDRNEAVVSNLGAADFTVEIDGKPREIVSAELIEYAKPDAPAAPGAPAPPPRDAEITTNEPADRGRLILLVVDQNSLRAESRPVLDAAGRWVMTLGPLDRVGLVTFPNVGPRVDFTTDHEKVADTLKRVVGSGRPPSDFFTYNISVWESVRMVDGDTFTRNEVVARECRGVNSGPNCPPDVEAQARQMVMDARSQVDPVWRSLQSIMRGLAPIPGPKHAVLISAGWGISERDAATELAWVAAEAAKATTTIHTFTAEQWAMAASTVRLSHKPMQDQALLLMTVETIAGMTGGRSVRLVGSYDGTFTRLNSGLTGYYRLGVQALPEDLDGKNHRINLKVTRTGAKLQSYRRVLAATPAAPKEAVPPETALREALKGGEPQRAIDVRATSYVLHGAGASRDLRIVAVGDVGRASAGTATVVAALYETDGRPVVARQNTVDVPTGGRAPISIELTAPPGAYALRVAVLDAEGRLGSLERLVEARWMKAGPLETPGIVLFRAGAGTGNAPRPVFDAVTTADRLIVQIALAGPADERRADVSFVVVKLGSTTPVLTRAATIALTTGGATVAQETLQASLLEPGRYTLQAKVGGARPFMRTFTVEAAATPPAAGARP